MLKYASSIRFTFKFYGETDVLGKWETESVHKLEKQKIKYFGTF